jgi:hypothetical protein
MGHLDQQQQNVHSTKRKLHNEATEEADGINNTNTLQVYPWALPTSLNSVNQQTNPTLISLDGSWFTPVMEISMSWCSTYTTKMPYS